VPQPNELTRIIAEALALSRSRSSWNDRFEHWERPASDTEELQIDRAADMVRKALATNQSLGSEGVTVAAQGSYYNNTNVRLESDMDLRAVHPFLRLEYAEGVVVDYARTVLGITDAGRTYTDVAQGMRREIVETLGSGFGAANIDASGNKAIRVKQLPGSRAPVDVVPVFRYYWVMWNGLARQYDVAEGIAILSKNGQWTHNFPEQHHGNGMAKRVATRHRFKRNVRILKNLRDELEALGLLTAKRVPSFLIECLTYAVEDGFFLVDSDDRYGRVLRLLSRTEALLNDPNWISTATEINGIKYLFRPQQPWMIDDARAFVQAALRRLRA
jgi:hypothetical protein